MRENKKIMLVDENMSKDLQKARNIDFRLWNNISKFEGINKPITTSICAQLVLILSILNGLREKGLEVKPARAGVW